MNGWGCVAVVLAVVCFATACGTVQKGRSFAQAACPLTPALSPDGGEGEDLAAGGGSGERDDQDARFARADSVGKWGSTESHPAGNGLTESPTDSQTESVGGPGRRMLPLTPALSPPPRKGEGGEAGAAGESGKVMQKWNPLWWLGNVDDPEPPDWYRPGSANRRWLWQLRNPLHNFTFYVIGIADKPFSRTGRFPAAVFAPEGGWNWAVARHKWVRLPFVSYHGKWGRFYLGWRERGNFGGKVNFGKLPAPESKRQTLDPAPSASAEKK